MLPPITSKHPIVPFHHQSFQGCGRALALSTSSICAVAGAVFFIFGAAQTPTEPKNGITLMVASTFLFMQSIIALHYITITREQVNKPEIVATVVSV